MNIKIAGRRHRGSPPRSFYFNLLLCFSPIILVLFFLPLYTPWILNKDIKAEKDWFPKPLHFFLLHKNKIISENIASIINVLFAKELRANISIPQNKIWIENGGLDKLNHQTLFWNIPFEKEKLHLTKRRKTRVKGYFFGKNGKHLKARINIRGTRANHQMIWKPSIKIRLKKNKLYKGFRDQIFIAPEDPLGLRNWISSELGRKWNLLNNLEYFSRLYINNINFGLYNTVAPFNESLLIHLKKLPGPIFNFNIYNKQLFNIWKKDWFLPDAWKIEGKKYKFLTNTKSILVKPLTIGAILNSWEKESKNQISEYLKALNHYISQEHFSKYLAILAHSGERHYLDNHNARFWFNPSSGLLEPIIYDQNGYGFSNILWIKRPIIKNEGAFVRAWFKNPLNQATYIKSLNELINTIGNKNEMEKLIRNQWIKIKPIAETELFLSHSCWPARCFFPINKLDNEINRLINDINLRLDWIEKELARDQVILIEKNNSDFQVLVMGFSGIIAKRKDGKRFNFSNLNYPTFYNPNFIQKANILKGVLLPSKSILKANVESVKFENSYSFYVLSGKPTEYIFDHLLSGKKIDLIDPKPNLNVKKLAAFSGVNYLNFEKMDKLAIVIGPGKVVFKESKVFNPGQPVIIKEGTNLFLDKGVQVVVQGPLTILGTKNDPVTIKPLDPKKPFGVFALIGNKTTGSRISYLNMEGGSIGNFYNLKFSGMLSVHECPNVTISNSSFGKNYIGDDAVHIINSKVIIKETEFNNSKMDALDLDLVTGELVSNQFIYPGNDGLDLSMSNIIMNKNSFSGCKDKCISAGEGTKLKIKNSYIRNCNIGIAVKDKSFATLTNSTIDSCNIAWNSYRKKWRWELGGRGEIINSKLINSRLADIKGDKFSCVVLSEKNLKSFKVNGKIKIN